eukprot:UN03143
MRRIWNLKLCRHADFETLTFTENQLNDDEKKEGGVKTVNTQRDKELANNNPNNNKDSSTDVETSENKIT